MTPEEKVAIIPQQFMPRLEGNFIFLSIPHFVSIPKSAEIEETSIVVNIRTHRGAVITLFKQSNSLSIHL